MRYRIIGFSWTWPLIKPVSLPDFRPEDWVAGENLEMVEIVEHRTIADFQSLLLPLTFRTEADFLYCSEEY